MRARELFGWLSATALVAALGCDDDVDPYQQSEVDESAYSVGEATEPDEVYGYPPPDTQGRAAEPGLGEQRDVYAYPPSRARPAEPGLQRSPPDEQPTERNERPPSETGGELERGMGEVEQPEQRPEMGQRPVPGGQARPSENLPPPSAQQAQPKQPMQQARGEGQTGAMSSIQNAVERLRSLEQRLVKMQQGAAEQADQQIEQSQPTAPSTDIGNELQPLIDDVRAALNELGASGAAEQPQEE